MLYVSLLPYVTVLALAPHQGAHVPGLPTTSVDEVCSWNVLCLGTMQKDSGPCAQF